jgi:thiamine-phosphate pyrophosphorylase
VKSLEHARLYGIADLGYVPEADLERVVDAMCAGGVDVLQLRAKGYAESQIEEFGCRIEPITRAAAVPLIINDFPELVPSIGAQGRAHWAGRSFRLRRTMAGRTGALRRGRAADHRKIHA